MDTITQIALGAAVGEATLGHRVGRKAAVWGAVCGTLPDLDILVPFSDPVSAFTYHRSFSHSLFVLALLTPLVVWLIRKVHVANESHKLGWYLLVYLAFATHVLLDSCTIYGTQIFWPIDNTPMTWGSVFIIDPAYTLILLIGLMAVILSRRNALRGYRINAAALVLSTLYLGWSFAAKFHAQNVAKDALAAQGIEYQRIVTLASPFNTILWRFVAVDHSVYYTGWYSLMDDDREIRFTAHPSDPGLLAGIENYWPVARLRWFTRGFYSVSREGDEIIISDLRMGIEGSYVFRFKVGEAGNPHTQATAVENRGQTPDLSLVSELWERLRGQRTGLTCCS